MEFLIAGCFIFPLSALWIQSSEDDKNEDEWTFSESSPGGRQDRGLQLMGQKIRSQHGESNTHQRKGHSLIFV